MKKGKSSWIALVGLSVANLVGCLDLTIVNTALPSLQTSLGLNDIQLQWIMNTLLLALAACMVVAGKLANRYGRRLVLYIGMLLFAITSLGAGLASNCIPPPKLRHQILSILLKIKPSFWYIA